MVDAEAALDAGLRAFDELREQRADGRRARRRRCARQFDAQEVRIREARRSLESVRAEAAQLDVARATAEADLTHLAATCVEAVQATLDEVAAEVEELERTARSPARSPVDDAPEPAEVEDEADAGRRRGDAAPPQRAPATAASMTPDEMVADLRAKIERMGAVNMMAIDQFDDLESRHAFLTTQRKDLVDSIAATNEAIKKIDKTTKERFREAFTAINENFERPSRRCSAAAAPAWCCSTRAISSRAASTSSRSRPASGSRACSCSRAARRR